MHTSWFHRILLSPDPETSNGGGSQISLSSTPEASTISLKDADDSGGRVPAVAPAVVVPAPASASVERQITTSEQFLEAIGVKGLSETDPRFGQFKDLKAMLGKAMENNTNLTTRVAAFDAREAQLVQEIAGAKAAVKNGTGTPEDVKLVQAQLTSLQSKYDTDTAALKEYQARSSLESNPAFIQKFMGGSAELINSAKETALQVGLTEEAIDQVFSSKTELDVHRKVNDLELQDPIAVRLLTEKALGYLKLNGEKESLLSGKTGKKASEIAAEWEAHNAQLGGVLTRKFTTEMQGQMIAAVDTAKTSLEEKSPMFKTDNGALVLDSIRSRFNEGFDLPPVEVVEGLAWAQLGPIYERTSFDQAAKIRTLEAQISAMTGQSPAASQKPASGSSKPAASTPFLVRTGQNQQIDLLGGVTRSLA